LQTVHLSRTEKWYQSIPNCEGLITSVRRRELHNFVDNAITDSTVALALREMQNNVVPTA